MAPLGAVSHRFNFLILILIEPTGKRPSTRPGRRWEENIIMDLTGIGFNTRNWVDSAQDIDYWRGLVNAAFYFRVS